MSLMAHVTGDLLRRAFCLTAAESVSLPRFLVGSDSDSDEDDKRVVRSAKDRRGEELRTTCDEMRVSANCMPLDLWAWATVPYIALRTAAPFASCVSRIRQAVVAQRF